MDWITLNSEGHLDEIKEKSKERYQLIFKFSNRCSLSTVIKNRLERSDIPANIDFHFLDLINHRNLSNKIAEDFAVYHESPQVLLIKDGECIYDESHSGIQMNEITQQAV